MDASITRWFYELAQTNTLTQWVSIICAEYLAYVLVLLFAGYVLVSLRSRREQLIAFGLACAAGALARFGVGSLIRYFYHRPRPFLTLDIHPLIIETSYSFPSGHATFFFAFSTVAYLYNKKLGMFLYGATLIMTLARIATGVHYPTDIIAGALIGIACGWLVHTYLLPPLTRALKTRLE